MHFQGLIVLLMLALGECGLCSLNEECTLWDLRSGRCVPLQDCPEINALVNLDIQYDSINQRITAVLQACGGDENSSNPLVCCNLPAAPIRAITTTTATSVTDTPKPTATVPTRSSRIFTVVTPRPTANVTDTPRTTLFIPTKKRRITTTVRPTPSVQVPTRRRTLWDVPAFRDVLPERCGLKAPSNHMLSDVEDDNHEHIWAVLLDLKNTKKGRCAGSMLSSRFVLTAAHCPHKLPAADIWLYYGAFAVSELRKCMDSDICQERNAADVFIHPDYDDHRRLNDIALIRVDEPVETTDRIMPLCLPLNFTFDENLSDQYGPDSPPLLSYGWGNTANETLSDTKRVISLTVLKLDECLDELMEFRVFNDTGLPSTYLCTKARVGDFCQGDSGAPLLHIHGHQMHVVGVHNFGQKCGMDVKPGISTRVSEYTAWILSTMKKSLTP